MDFSQYNGGVPPVWDNQEAVHVFEDGYGMFRMQTMNDCQQQVLTCCWHCVTSEWWEEKLFPKGYRLYTLRHPDGWGLVTLSCADANFIIGERVKSHQEMYASCTSAADQTPRLLEDGAVIPLEIAGYDYGEGHDTRVKEWYESLPISEEHAAYKVDGMYGLKKSSEDFIFERTRIETLAAEAARAKKRGRKKVEA